MKARTTGAIAAVAIAALATTALMSRARPRRSDVGAASSETALSARDGARAGVPPSRPAPPALAPALLALASAQANGVGDGEDQAKELAAALERHQGMGDRFEKEGRDPVWAPAREREVKDSVERDFTAGKQDAWVSSIRCHTTTCRLEVSSPSAAGLEQAKLMLSYAPRAAAIQFGGDSLSPANEHVASYVLEFEGISRDPETYAEWQGMARQGALEGLARLRAGRALPDGVPSAPPL
jgi:hypothetical protein